MFLLPNTDGSGDAAELEAEIRAGLGEYLEDAGKGVAVGVVGDDPAHRKRIEVRLEGALVDLARFPRPTSDRAPGPEVDELELLARGVRVRGAALDLTVTAVNVRLARAMDEGGRTILVAKAAKAGEAFLFAPIESLRGVVEGAIRSAAERQGIRVVAVGLQLMEEEGAVRVRIPVTVKKLATARIVVSGLLVSRPGLAVGVSSVVCRGEGLAGKAVARLARPAVEGLSGRQLGLADFFPAGLRPDEVTLLVGEGLGVHGRLGGCEPSSL